METYKFTFRAVIFAVLVLRIQCSIPIIQVSNEIIVTNIGDGYTVTMDENNHNFTEPLALFKIDVENCDGYTPTFLENRFQYIIEECIFYSNKSFDYETENERIFKILLYSVNNTDSSNININVNNIDDENPTLLCPKCFFDENAIYTIENTTCKYTLSDPDGWLSYTTFTIMEATTKEIFFVAQAEGVDDKITKVDVPMYNLIELDYESVNLYTFTIQVEDSGHNKDSQIATVYVNDTRDTLPQWTNPLYAEQFEEKTHQDFYTKAIDGDKGLNKSICYFKKKEGDISNHDGNYIEIKDKTVGHIEVNNINRDEYDINMYYLVIQACVCDLEDWCTDQDITFYIQDIDDNSPLILTNDYTNGTTEDLPQDKDKKIHLSFLENYDKNFNFSSNLKDLDTGENAQFTVELIKSGDYDYTVAYIVIPSAGYKNGDFQINVKNKSYLDYENDVWKNHEFYLHSYGIDKTKEDRMLVTISLEDYNDEIPIFSHEEYSASLKETAKTGTFVIQCPATDRDAEDETLDLEIIGTYAKNRLDIYPNGSIFVNLKNPDGDDFYFDYDILNSVFFQVTATDQVGHKATVLVTITILDVNNKAPTIEPVSPITVEENKDDGFDLAVKIKATDPDTNANLTATIDWTNSYATKNSIILDMSNETNKELINFLKAEINPSNGGGEITISLIVTNSDAKKPDFETFDSVYLNLVVTDLMTDPDYLDKQSTSETVLIRIENINDNPPYFPDDNKDNRTVQERAVFGTSVGTIRAVDPDIGDNITYSCNPINHPLIDWINVNKDTGAFSVKDGVSISADEPKIFYINYICFASDGLHLSEPLQVPFYIIDTNDKSPVISLIEPVEITEKSDKDTEVTTIGTKDKDRDIPFHTVSCTLQADTSTYSECADQFMVDKENVIRVINGNDEIDRDHGRDHFSCNLSCHDNPSYERYQAPFYVSYSFIIKLIDINDNDPELVTTELECWESLDKSEDIGQRIIGTDIDEGDNAAIVFNVLSIENDNEDITSLFTIVTGDDYEVNDTFKAAHLITTDALRGHYGEYNMNMKLNDKGTPEQRSSTGTIKLTIKKFNFASPVITFPDDDEVFILLSTQTIRTPLIFYKDPGNLKDFTATDGETEDCSKWNVNFKFAQINDDPDDIFELENPQPCVSQLQINKNFNADVVIGKTYNLQITAWLNDSVISPQEDEKPYSSTVNIALKFLDNNQEPYFKDDTPWEFNLHEDSTTESAELKQKATYEVDDEDLKVFYFLIGDDNTINFFNVDPNSGDVSIKNKFYYDDNQKFEFQILASKDSNPKNSLPNSALEVTVNVLSINRRPPEFTSDAFFGAIMPTYRSGTTVTNITAIDPDEIDKGKLKYSISSDIYPEGSGLDNIVSEPFYIVTTNDDVGQIQLNFDVQSAMSGLFKFSVNVTDQAVDDGPHSAITSVTILIITSDNTVDFKLFNNLNDVQTRQTKMLEIVKKWVGYSAYIQNIFTKIDDGQTFTIASLYFINSNSTSIELITSEAILRIVSDVNTFSDMANELKTEQLYLYGFPVSASKTNSEAVLRAWLTAVAVSLGVLCLALIVILIWKTRQLSKRISNLTIQKFGSQESGLNRIGVSAPTTNKHAIEGSNPIYKTEDIKKSKDMADFDTNSVRSGDSDLIGIENNPEFDYNFNPIDDKTTYL